MPAPEIYFEGRRGLLNIDGSSLTPKVERKKKPQQDGLDTGSVPRSSSWSKLFSRKHKGTWKKTNSSGTLTPETTHAIMPDALDSDGAVSAATEQVDTAQNVQAKASLTSKLRWKGQKKDFLMQVDAIKASNDLISSMVSMIALGSIHNILIFPKFQGDVPEFLFSVQNSLIRLHHALNRSNPANMPVTISLRVMKAESYVQLKKKLTILHDYIKFDSNSVIYPLQLQPSAAPSSTFVLAETIMTAQDYEEVTPVSKIPLSGMLLGVCTDTDEPFREIGSIVDAQSSTDFHYLFEDISTSWILQDTLADLIAKESKFSTYIHLAVQVSMSYIFFLSIGATHRYARLADYRYYKPIEDAKRSLGPMEILEPYLCVGFGSKAPRKSTKDIGGASSQFSGDEAMTSLGLLLHQLGCWKILEDEDLATARDVAKTQRIDLQTKTGHSYTEIVDVCFSAKEDDWDSRVRTEKLYQKVVAPLQKLVADLHWE